MTGSWTSIRELESGVAKKPKRPTRLEGGSNGSVVSSPEKIWLDSEVSVGPMPLGTAMVET